ncbi:MAG: hypothetical protein A2V52_01200 [Actinobacteria bacterium RBG_19FT_COMBO_54_7]|uniref:Hemerythrin-like domain-containing protein n=1 Tax=Candidatus Solincola sediminis TaxID=1797199 RepID=A0A1F2WNS5_9ACTN|nr:MAG: hypothetical protein A2Y75_02715 [Candidatus Solincola sediminis]OFW59536.1 MAG: hypothetical protein A2W01_06395 [Candidatus Solincola sediminis]OFW68719.1 MAG: hypothetical protein A2V52_01200 [Actinobacteria bacterium RBG_19FT_COMBO_54_7]
MKPIGPLMIEHRLIERMIRLLKAESERASNDDSISSAFIDGAVDFFRTYADRTHHGKEEDILFIELQDKDLPEDLKSTMDLLIEQHRYARRTVGALADANKAYQEGETDLLKDMRSILDNLAEFYPRHIEIEDKHFFIPCLDYFDQGEQDAMLQTFYDFDRKMIHEKYGIFVETFEIDLPKP